MTDLPDTLEQAITQARAATQAAIAAGYSRLQIDLLFPELKPMPVAQKLLMDVPLDTWLPTPCKVFFADAGAGALARRDWQGAEFAIFGFGELKAQIQEDDRAFVLIAPSPVDVETVQSLAAQAGDRPFVMFNAQLEDSGIIGIGYAGRKLREQFLNTFEPCYYLRPLDQAALIRCYPSPWQVWLEKDGSYQLIAEEQLKPVGENLDRTLMQATASPRRRGGFLTELQRLMRALTR
jgi:hypothetical protein